LAHLLHLLADVHGELRIRLPHPRWKPRAEKFRREAKDDA